MVSLVIGQASAAVWLIPKPRLHEVIVDCDDAAHSIFVYDLDIQAREVPTLTGSSLSKFS